MDFSDLLTESDGCSDYLSFAAAARSMAPGSLHVSTISRWVIRGVEGLKLPTVAIGGRRYIRRADLLEFLALLNSAEPSKNEREEQYVKATSAAAGALLAADKKPKRN